MKINQVIFPRDAVLKGRLILISSIRRARRLLNKSPLTKELNKTFKNFTEKSYHEIYFRSMLLAAGSISNEKMGELLIINELTLFFE